MLAPAVSFAQDQSSAPPAPEPEVTTDEIVVTATHRSANILDVPVAVSTYDAKSLERAGLNDVKRLQTLSPSLNVTTTQGDTQGAVIRVRGIGTSGSNPGLESATGVSIDGIFRSRSNVALGDLLGIERIELLRGPQGTLFGKNTTAGVLNIITRKPSFTSEFEGSATFGNYDLQQFTASASGPLIADTLAARIDALYSHRDGWIKSSTSDQRYADRDRYSLRGQLYWTPTEDFSVRMIADYTKRNESSANPPTYRVVGPTGALIGALGGVAPVAEDPPTSRTAQIDNISPRFDRYREYGLSTEMNWQVGPGTLTAITAYRDAKPDRSFDVDGSPADVLRDVTDGERYKTFTQEARYQGVTGRLDYLVGAFYSNERIESRDGVKASPIYESYLVGLLGGVNFMSMFSGLPAGANYPAGSGQADIYRQKSESFALFTHNSYKLTDSLTLTAGLRYTTETKQLNAQISSNGPGCAATIARFGPALAGVPASLRGVVCSGTWDPRYDGDFDGKRSESEWSGTAALGYAFNDNLNGYVSYARGYKGGGYQYDRSGLLLSGPDVSQLAFRPELADSYEAGLKGVFLDGVLRANAAAFYTKVTDYQFNYLRVLPLQTARVTANLPELLSKGVELDMTVRPVKSLTFTGAVTYNETDYGKSNFPAELVQLEGTTAPYAPRWSITASVNYEQAISDTGLEAFVYLDANWRSKTNLSFSATTTAPFFQGDYALANARIGIGNENGRWQVEGFVRNLFDKSAWSGLYNATAQSGSIEGFFIEPRFYGVTLRTRW